MFWILSIWFLGAIGTFTLLVTQRFHELNIDGSYRNNEYTTSELFGPAILAWPFMLLLILFDNICREVYKEVYKNVSSNILSQMKSKRKCDCNKKVNVLEKSENYGIDKSSGKLSENTKRKLGL